MRQMLLHENEVAVARELVPSHVFRTVSNWGERGTLCLKQAQILLDELRALHASPKSKCAGLPNTWQTDEIHAMVMLTCGIRDLVAQVAASWRAYDGEVALKAYQKEFGPVSWTCVESPLGEEVPFEAIAKATKLIDATNKAIEAHTRDEEWLDKSIQIYRNSGLRIVNHLWTAYFRKMRDLTKVSWSDLLRVDGMGIDSITTIERWLKYHGHALRPYSAGKSAEVWVDSIGLLCRKDHGEISE